MESTSVTNGHSNDVGPESFDVLSTVLDIDTRKPLPGTALSDELIKELFAENASLRQQARSEPKVGLGVLKQQERYIANLHTENQELKKALQEHHEAKFMAADLMTACYDAEVSNHEKTSVAKESLKLALVEAKGEIARLERLRNSDKRVIKDQAVRLEATNYKTFWE